LEPKSTDQREVAILAFSTVNRVGLPVVGRVRTRMSWNATPRPNVGPAEPISTSRSLAAAWRIAISLARPYGKAM
jgi:hypothetical protein